MPKFRKKPVVIEAERWDGSTSGMLQLERFTRLPLSINADHELIIHTLEDGINSQVQHAATPGDWIIRGIQGEFYPCKPDIFEKTYEAVEN